MPGTVEASTLSVRTAVGVAPLLGVVTVGAERTDIVELTRPIHRVEAVEQRFVAGTSGIDAWAGTAFASTAVGGRKTLPVTRTDMPRCAPAVVDAVRDAVAAGLRAAEGPARTWIGRVARRRREHHVLDRLRILLADAAVRIEAGQATRTGSTAARKQRIAAA